MSAFARRAALIGLAGIPFATLFAGRGGGASADLETVTTQTPSGRALTGLLSVPSKTPAPAVLLIHGASGLNDFYRSVPVEFARRRFVGLMVDLFDGVVPTDASHSLDLVHAAEQHPERATETIVTWIDWLRGEHRANGKVGLIGYSFGAEWALRTAISTPVDATVLNVGLMLPTVKQLARLNGPMLGHFCDRGTDPFPSQVELLEARMKQAGRSFEVHWYAADHAFLMPAHHDYNKEAADASWARTTEFLHNNLQ